jgi:predicted ABC-type ATPase
MPVLHLIAGPHGVGKTALYRYLLEPHHPDLPFVDAAAWPAGPAVAPGSPTWAEGARLWADEQRQQLMRERRSFVTETAFSHRSRVALVTQARSLGYEVVLWVLAVDEPRLLLQRLRERDGVAGRRPLDSTTVLGRYSRCLTQLRQAVFLADLAVLLDGADIADGGPRVVASLRGQDVQVHSEPRPRWVDRVLGWTSG